MSLRTNRKRPTLIKARSHSVNSARRVSLTYESVNLQSILNRDQNMTPASRAARSIKRREHRLRFRSRGTVIDITPLADKPQGRVRMPVSPVEIDDDDEGIDDIIDKENFAPFMASRPSLSEVLLSTLRHKSNVEIREKPASIANLSVAIEFQSALKQPSISELTESTSLIEPVAVPNVSNLWSAEESEAYELGQKCHANGKRNRSELWSTLFSPHKKCELFNSSICVYNWFEAWYKRLSTRKPDDPPSAKRKRRSIMYEVESDEEYQCPDVDLPNPLIISGPSGCGKTTSVYCAAEQNRMRVLEFSPSERRNGASLEKKLSGAIDSHYIHSNSHSIRKTHDIRQMFSPKNSKTNGNAASTSNGLSSYNFSVVLIDDCDVLFSTDDNFWSTMKNMFDEAKIPIVLTCSNYDYVKKKLSTDVAQSEWVQYVAPSVIRISRQLRPWIAGYACKLLTQKWLRRLIESRRMDVRGVLNELQFQVGSSRLDDVLDLTATSISLKSHACCAYALSTLDAAFNANVTPPAVSWRAKELADLDYRADIYPAYQLCRREYLSMQNCDRLVEALAPITNMKQFAYFSSPSSYSADRSPLKVLRDAWMRSLPGMATPYSWRAVGTDYMSCLCAVDAKFKRENRERLNRITAESTTRRRGRPLERDRAQHPFDDICSANCESIDKIGGLRLSIESISEVYLLDMISRIRVEHILS